MKAFTPRPVSWSEICEQRPSCSVKLDESYSYHFGELLIIVANIYALCLLQKLHWCKMNTLIVQTFALSYFVRHTLEKMTTDFAGNLTIDWIFYKSKIWNHNNTDKRYSKYVELFLYLTLVSSIIFSVSVSIYSLREIFQK